MPEASERWFWALAAIAGATLQFVLTTTLMDTVPDAALVALPCLVALAATVALGGLSPVPDLWPGKRRAVFEAAGAGALAFGVAPLVALFVRATDAPTGSESLFFSAAAWGVIVVVFAAAVRSEPIGPAGVAGAVAALAGGAALLGTWERPSSFSPFARFVGPELAMLAAGLAFAAGAVLLARALKVLPARDAAAIALAAATVVATVVALPVLPAAVRLQSEQLLPAINLGLVVALFVAGWVRTSKTFGIAPAGVSLLAVPVGVTALAAVERTRTVYGPSPVDWPSALAAIAAILGGCVVAWMGVSPAAEKIGPRRRALLGTAVALFSVATLSLFLPALSATSEGHVLQPFSVSWFQSGAESASGWLAVAAAGLAWAALESAWRRRRVVVTYAVAAASCVCAAATLPLASTTLHTWQSWVPADVQQAYGTEYAQFAVTAVNDPVRLVLVGASVAVAVYAAVLAARGAGARPAIEE